MFRKQTVVVISTILLIMTIGALSSGCSKQKAVPQTEQQVIENLLGKSSANDDKPTFMKVTSNEPGTEVFELGAGGTKKTMWLDTIEIVPALFKFNSDLSKIIINWHLDLENAKGNVFDARVMQVTFTRKNSDSITWNNVKMDNIPKIADDYWEHTALNN